MSQTPLLSRRSCRKRMAYRFPICRQANGFSQCACLGVAKLYEAGSVSVHWDGLDTFIIHSYIQTCFIFPQPALYKLDAGEVTPTGVLAKVPFYSNGGYCRQAEIRSPATFFAACAQPQSLGAGAFASAKNLVRPS